jgi:hypothetical protein
MALTVAQIDAEIAKIQSAGQRYRQGDFEFERGRLSDLLAARKAAVEQERVTGKTMFQRVRFGKVGM